jgi:hypothetical protein
MIKWMKKLELSAACELYKFAVCTHLYVSHILMTHDRKIRDLFVTYVLIFT